MNVLFIFPFEMDPPAKNTSETGCKSHKVYLNSWVTEIGGCERIQTNVNSSVFGVDCSSPLFVAVMSVSYTPPWILMKSPGGFHLGYIGSSQALQGASLESFKSLSGVFQECLRIL